MSKVTSTPRSTTTELQQNVRSSEPAAVKPKPEHSAISQNDPDQYEGPNAAAIPPSATRAAQAWGNLDPTRGRGLVGVEYTPKVRGQMRLNPTTALPDNHGFPRMVDSHARHGKSFAFAGGDGKVRGGIELPGAYNGRDGKFQWIVEQGGKKSNHRVFVPKGKPGQIPRSAIIPGSGAARVAGRVMLPLAVAADSYEIATAENKPKKAAEKAGAWATSMGATAVAAKVASPLLAAGPPGWVGYGAAVLGTGVVSYAAGSQLGKGIYNWFTGN
ncbi:MAG: hypothetical protein VYC39_15885 [Myxococcota bacterium]|nr:hypothetical protein [Myxococcota bacterium]